MPYIDWAMEYRTCLRVLGLVVLACGAGSIRADTPAEGAPAPETPPAGVPVGGATPFGAPPAAGPAPAGTEQKSKLVAGLLGIFLGALGIHRFYLGYNTIGIIQVVVSVVVGIPTCGIATAAVSIWGLVEGILILTGSINRDAKGVPLKD